MMDVVYAVAFNLMEYWIFLLLLQYVCAAHLNLNRRNGMMGTGIAAVLIGAAAALLGDDGAYIATYLAVLLSILLFAGKRRRALLRLFPAFVLYFTLTVIPAAMVDVLFSVRETETGTALLMVSVDLILYGLLVLLRYVVKKYRLIVSFGAKETLGCIFLFFFTYIDGQLLALMNRQHHEPAAHYGYAALFAAVYLASVGYYAYSIADRWKRILLQTRTRAEMEYLQLQLAALDDAKKSGEQTRRMRHDLNKHLAVMRMLCDEGKYDEVSEYARQLNDESIASGVRLLTGNEVLDLIAGQKKKRCEENGIEFTFDGLVGGLGEMTAPDICGLFANAYDNAIEACMGQSGAYVRTSVRRVRSRTAIEIVNSVEKKVSLHRNGAQRKKDQDGAHGYGMEIMRRIACKYNGSCTFHCDEKEFRVKIVL